MEDKKPDYIPCGPVVWEIFQKAWEDATKDWTTTLHYKDGEFIGAIYSQGSAKDDG